MKNLTSKEGDQTSYPGLGESISRRFRARSDGMIGLNWIARLNELIMEAKTKCRQVNRLNA